MALQTITNSSGNAAEAENTGWFGSRAMSRMLLRFRPAAPSAEPIVNRRYFARARMKFDAVIHASDGTPGWKVKGVDIHRLGAQVIADRPLAPGSLVYFHLPRFQKMGFAHVRHCGLLPGGEEEEYRIGLEFRGQLIRAEFGTWHICYRREC